MAAVRAGAIGLSRSSRFTVYASTGQKILVKSREAEGGKALSNSLSLAQGSDFLLDVDDSQVVVHLVPIPLFCSKYGSSLLPY